MEIFAPNLLFYMFPTIVGFVDNLLVVIDGGNLAVVPYYAKVAACDGGGAGGGGIHIRTSSKSIPFPPLP